MMFELFIASQSVSGCFLVMMGKSVQIDSLGQIELVHIAESKL